MSRSRVDVLLVLACVLVVSSCVEGGLTLNKKCGQKICGDKEFCSSFDNICRPCDTVCELGSHNYQEDMCQKDCQDYLHDRLYVKRDEKNMGNLQDDIRQLYTLMTTLLVVCVVILVIMAFFLFCLIYLFLRAKQSGLYSDKLLKKITALQKNSVSSKDVEAAEAQKATYAKNEPLKLEINNPPVGPSNHVCPPLDPVTPNTMSTPLSCRPPRHPSEDTTLEYAAYDNPGLTPSPVLEKGDEPVKVAKRESSF